MIATFRRHGRLGNRLFTFANLVAFSETYKVPLLVASFSEYRKDFPFFDENPHCLYPTAREAAPIASRPFLLRLAGGLGLVPKVRFWQPGSVYFDDEDSQDPRIELMKCLPFVVFEGWDFRSRRAIRELREKIIAPFRPRSVVLEEVERRIALLRGHGDVIVGVHIRWGDYRGTDRFFDLSEYTARMKEIRNLFSPSPVVFGISSPEEISQASLRENCFFLSNGSALEDLYTLARCDYIIGPPSTFSMWASYYGGKPLFILKKGRRFDDLSMARMATP